MTMVTFLLAATAVATAANTAAAAARQPPSFSWDTLPVAFHSCTSAAPLSPAQAFQLARFSMVTIEKYEDIAAVAPRSTLAPPYADPGGLYACQNGSDLSRCGCCAEDEIVRAARAIKAVDPTVVTIAYLNTQIVYPWYRAARAVATHPSWWLSGNKHDGPKGSTWHTVDLTVPEAAAAWQRTATNLTTTGAIDGVFADGCMRRESGPGLTPARVAALYAAKHDMLRGLQAALPGPIVCGSNGEFLPGVDAVQAEGWGVADGDVESGKTHFATLEIPLLMKAAAAGVIFQAHGRAVCGQAGEHPPCCDAPPCNCTTPPPDYRDAAVQTELAAFLVAAGTNSYYLCGSWEDTLGNDPSSAWMPVYDLPLGEPQGRATLGDDGVWRRSFASGTNVTFDTKAEKGSVQWAAAAAGS